MNREIDGFITGIILGAVVTFLAALFISQKYYHQKFIDYGVAYYDPKEGNFTYSGTNNFYFIKVGDKCKFEHGSNDATNR